MSNKTLYVVTAIFNPHRYKSRIKLYRDFEKYMADSGADLYTVEAAFRDRPFAVTEAGNPHDLQLRTWAELWHKERMINLGIQRLPHDWEYVAWIDADVVFSRPDWVMETVDVLQHYPVVQMFSEALDLTPTYEVLHSYTGVMAAYQQGTLPRFGGRYDQTHPGFAWAARREALNNLGGLFDLALLGSADRHMAFSFMECVEKSCPKGLSPGYLNQIMNWQERSKKYIKRNVGYVPGAVLHHWHGKKVDRRYADRWKIAIRHQYDPELDIKPDTQGLWQYTDRCPELEYDIRKYFLGRSEDSIDL